MNERGAHLDPSDRINWDPNDWQKFAKLLIQMRHGPTNVVDMPDGDRGDRGLECITLTGEAYQCYAPQHANTVATRRERIQSKIYEDTEKLSRYKGDLTRLYKTKTKMSRWILTVPRSDSTATTLYCSDRSEHIRSLGLPFISADFEILVHDLSFFDVEARRVTSAGVGLMQLDSGQVDDNLAFDWRERHRELYEKMKEKLEVGFPDDDEYETEERVTSLIKDHIRMSNSFETLRMMAPDLYTIVVRIIECMKNDLVTIGPVGSDPQGALMNTLTQLTNNLSSPLCGYDHSTHKTISRGQLAAWLMNCPLKFRRKRGSP